MTRTEAGVVQLLNTLPEALHHYAGALEDQLRTAGWSPIARTASIERATGSRLSRLSRLLRAYWELRSPRDCVVVLWPPFGVAEPLVWRVLRPRRDTIIVLHDPRSLRGDSHLPLIAHRLLARAGTTPRVRVVVHSEAARQEVRSLGWVSPFMVPLPIGAQRESPNRDRSVVVLGQYKASRDLDVLARIGVELLQRGYCTRILGRSWPEIPGWDVEDRFLSESEFDSVLSSCGCVLIPYQHSYQSDVAVRALEWSTPIVGSSGGYLEELLGHGWPGLVHGDDARAWTDAVERCQRAETIDTLRDCGKSLSQRAVGAWQGVLSWSY